MLLNEQNFIKFNGCGRQAALMAKMPLPQSRGDRVRMSKRLKAVQEDMLKSFPPGRRIQALTKSAAEETAQLVREGANAIYGAVFTAGSFLCRCDVIVKRGGCYDVYAVRPTDKYTRWIDEVLYDRAVMKMSGVPAGGAYICVIDRNASGRDMLLTVDAEGANRQKSVEAKLFRLSEAASRILMPEASLCSKCASCAFFPQCFDAGEDSVFSLKSIPFAKRVQLYASGFRSAADYAKTPGADARAVREIKVRLTDEDVYDKEAIRAFLNNLSFPLGFLDFETMEVFIPNDPVLKPMDTVITQFSYHLIEREGGEIKHFDFIGDGENYPERDAARELTEVISPSHCVLMYSNYEKVCIDRLIQRLPEYAEKLCEISKRLVDLEKPFEKKLLVNRRMEGKSGLKTVLPALYPGEKALDYKYMRIHNGLQAESVYARLPKMDEEEKRRAVKDLRDYCALDTLAMIKLWEKLVYYGGKI